MSVGAELVFIMLITTPIDSFKTSDRDLFMLLIGFLFVCLFAYR